MYTHTERGTGVHSHRERDGCTHRERRVHSQRETGVHSHRERERRVYTHSQREREREREREVQSHRWVRFKGRCESLQIYYYNVFYLCFFYFFYIIGIFYFGHAKDSPPLGPSVVGVWSMGDSMLVLLLLGAHTER